MTGTSIEISPTVAEKPIVATPVEPTGVVTFLDRSPFAERALPTARWIAACIVHDTAVPALVVPTT